jgi:uncharacterized protein (TIGR01777 family)
MKTNTATQTLVFYDGACAVCNAEMQILRGWDRAQRLNMIDIAAPGFDTHVWPVSVADMHALLHVRLPDGTWLNAMAATRHLYRAVGRGWMLAFTGWPVLASVFDRAYAWFARHRLPISTLLGLRRCTDGVCRIDHNTTHPHIEPALDVGAPHLKFLIAGGTGFIGTALTRRLIAGGHEVTLVARDPLRAAKQYHGAARCVTAAATLSPVEQFDVVVNLAGAPVVGAPWTRARKQMLLDSRLAPTDDLLRFAERAQSRPRVWIQASATGYYGQRATNIDEHTPAGISDFASELCHRWEARAQACAVLGIRYVALRFGVVLGRSGGSLPPMLLGLKLGAGSVIGSGRQFVSWIHIEDALGVIAHAVRDAKLTGPVNAVAPESLTYAAFMREAGTVTHRPVWLHIPEQLLRKLLGEMAIMLVEGPCVLPGKLRTLHHAFRFRTLRSALLDLA